MNSAHASHADSPGAGLASWYTPGRSDGFGDRLLMFDNTDAISLELLRFRRELAEIPGFENALRDRVDHLAHFRHPAFPLVRAAVHLDDHDLTLVSAHTPGQRLSELPNGRLRNGLHPAVVTWIVREVTTALAALQASGTAVGHGALSADRIVLTSDGRLCVVEHALGSAMRRLRVTPADFWRQFGLLAPVDARGLVRIDQRSDVVQLGTIALSLLLARPVTLDDFEGRLPALLDEFSALATVSASVFATPLRVWLERSLQLAPRSYRSAEDAQEGLSELPVTTGPAEALEGALLHLAVPHAEPDQAGENPEHAVVAVSRIETRRPLRPQFVRELPTQDPKTTARELEIDPELARQPAEKRRWMRSYSLWIAAAFGAIALAEGGIIATLGTQPALVSIAPPIPPIVSPRPASLTLVDTPTTAVLPAPPPTADPAKNRTESALAQAATRQRSGGVRWASPIELTVLEGDQVLGSTADGLVVITAGTHDLDLVNTSLGYRTRQTVTVRAGVITPLTVARPVGRININAKPWAQVLIDDSPIGETPLANVSVPLGQHQVTFRHPQLGERSETVTVRADTIARVIASFER